LDEGSDYTRFYEQAIKFKSFPGYALLFEEAFQIIQDGAIVKDVLMNEVNSDELMLDLVEITPFNTTELCYFFSNGYYNIFDDPQYADIDFYDPPY